MQPTVSIIMNCHNGQRYLSESIRSVINQSYKNWELIFYDNFSLDNSYSILKKFKDKRIRYFKSNKFLKLYAARNEAIKKAKGKYIAFIDTDDLWEKSKLTDQVNLIKKKLYNIIYSNYYILNKKKKFINFPFDLPSGKITEKLVKKYFIGILTVLIEKKIFTKNRFNEKYNIIGDFDLFMKLSTKYKIGAIQKPLATYRNHDLNLSKRAIKTHISELENWIKLNSKIFNKYSYKLMYHRVSLLKLKIKSFIQTVGRVVQW